MCVAAALQSSSRISAALHISHFLEGKKIYNIKDLLFLGHRQCRRREEFFREDF